jgi:hypothetical protein
MANPNAIPPQPWDGLEGLWDSIEIDDSIVPGLAAVDVHRENKWDTKKAKGSHGAKRDYQGADLATVTITLRLVTQDDYEDFVNDHLPVIEPDPGKKFPAAVSIVHAVTVARNCPVITIDKIDGPKIENGICTFTIVGTEFREPEKKNATGTVNGALGKNCADLLKQRQGQQAVLKGLQAAAGGIVEQLNHAKDDLAVGESHGVGGSTTGRPELAQNVNTAQAAADNNGTAQSQCLGTIAAIDAQMTALGCPVPPSSSAAVTGP